MENHGSEMEQMSSKILDLEEKLNLCQNSSSIERHRVSLLLESQKKCRKTLVKVSGTLEELTKAFKVQYRRSNVAESKLEKNLAHFSDLQKSLVLKDGMTIKLQDSNDHLREKVIVFWYSLHVVHWILLILITMPRRVLTCLVSLRVSCISKLSKIREIAR